MPQVKSLTKSDALKFIILLGIVSLFADMTYEGARSITGPFLAILGANAATVGIVAGLGEFATYILRFFSGYLADKTQRYWLITIVGYSVNVLAVPLLALSRHWEYAAMLIILERAGKALRTPARDVMLSYASHKIGRGRSFGLHQALDQVGAMIGPLIVAAVLYRSRFYSVSFAVLAVPALLTLIVLAVAYYFYPHPQHLEPAAPKLAATKFSRAFWWYAAAGALIALGYADFPLIAFHFQKAGNMRQSWIPLLYSLAMASDALAALVFGHLYDKIGLPTLYGTIALTALFAPLVFLGNIYLITVGMILWGIGLGIQASVMKAVIIGMVPQRRRGTAYGVFNLFFGTFWFIGSATMGMLYDFSLLTLVGFSVIAQLLSIPMLFVVNRLGK